MSVDPSQFPPEQIAPVPRGGTQSAPFQPVDPAPPGGSGAATNTGGGSSLDQLVNQALTQALSGLGATTTTPHVNTEVSAGDSLYLQIWGVQPPEHYIQGLVRSGLNLYEIAQHELTKPGAELTQFWRDNEASYAAQLASQLGRR